MRNGRQIKKKKFAIMMSIAFLLFSLTCFWEENSLRLLMVSGFVTILLTILIAGVQGVTGDDIVSCRAIWWIVVNYFLFETYGLLFLRIGTFNWDFVGFNGILLVCIAIMCLAFKSSSQLIDAFVIACKMGIIVVVIYMGMKVTLDFSSITFGTRFGSFLSGNVNTVATSFGIMFFPVFYSVIDRKGRDVIGIICCMIAVVCMLLTGSKKALLVLGVALFMAFLMFKSSFKYIIIPVLAIFGVYAIFSVPVLYNTIGFRIIDMLAAFGIGEAVTKAQSTNIRTELLLEGMKSFWNHPLFGGGMNYFQYINNAKYYAHNNYIEILNDFGLIGLTIHYCIAIKALLYFMRNKRRVSQEKKSVYVLCIMMIVMRLVLDLAMVSFSSLCTFYLPILIPVMVMYKERKEKNIDTIL